MKWILLVIICCLVTIIGYLAYLTIDQGTTFSYMKDGYSDTEEDLSTLIQINNLNLETKFEIRKFLEKETDYGYINFDTDTVVLNNIELLFSGEKFIYIAH